jgi:hypothetical protein
MTKPLVKKVNNKGLIIDRFLHLCKTIVPIDRYLISIGVGISREKVCGIQILFVPLHQLRMTHIYETNSKNPFCIDGVASDCACNDGSCQ